MSRRRFAPSFAALESRRLCDAGIDPPPQYSIYADGPADPTPSDVLPGVTYPLRPDPTPTDTGPDWAGTGGGTTAQQGVDYFVQLAVAAT